ncbi:hypothetical protein HYH03_006749 [Edaphochlamys debaryana]|uniref:Uncharacterized protein n=1 Tax=Edaphochlamys debaryana TaxID=47281 RepID=A0A835YA35_9CHLO|nr:hypothetical protein HYH03_006749 [Edaphochlamys debaryana]|eukprot:KAG2495140.1 hypothetical protein HYH03_006749 [Edaphochlamys debaryana]
MLPWGPAAQGPGPAVPAAAPQEGNAGHRRGRGAAGHTGCGSGDERAPKARRLEGEEGMQAITADGAARVLAGLHGAMPAGAREVAVAAGMAQGAHRAEAVVAALQAQLAAQQELNTRAVAVVAGLQEKLAEAQKGWDSAKAAAAAANSRAEEAESQAAADRKDRLWAQEETAAEAPRGAEAALAVARAQLAAAMGVGRAEEAAAAATRREEVGAQAAVAAGAGSSPNVARRVRTPHREEEAGAQTAGASPAAVVGRSAAGGAGPTSAEEAGAAPAAAQPPAVESEAAAPVQGSGPCPAVEAAGSVPGPPPPAVAAGGSVPAAATTPGQAARPAVVPAVLAPAPCAADAVMEVQEQERPEPPATTERGAWTGLHGAAWSGDVGKVEALIGGGATVDAREKFGRTPLHVAASRGHADVVEVLLDRGKAKVEATDKNWKTALHVAALEGHGAVVEVLLDKGEAKVDKVDKLGWTALQCAASQDHAGVVKALLARGANVEAKCEHGWTPLMRAAYNGHVEAVRAMLRGAADQAVGTDWYTRALEAARRWSLAEVVALLEEAVRQARRQQRRSAALNGLNANGPKPQQGGHGVRHASWPRSWRRKGALHGRAGLETHHSQLHGMRCPGAALALRGASERGAAGKARRMSGGRLGQLRRAAKRRAGLMKVGT